MFVDASQSGHAQVVAKLVEHAHVGHRVAIGQMGKAPPVPLLGEHLQQQIERVHRRQQRQKMDAPQLGRTENLPPSASWPAGQQLVDEIVGNVW